MIAWGCWDKREWEGLVYLYMAKCGSSCNHKMIRMFSQEDIERSSVDLFPMVFENFEAAFDHAHDSVERV